MKMANNQKNSTEIQAAVEKSKRIAVWIKEKLDGVTLNSSPRVVVASACLNIAMEHQFSISALIENCLYASAFALARPVFEAYVRGHWLFACATDAEVDDYIGGKLNRTFQSLIDGIEKDESLGNVLSRVKEKNGVICVASRTLAGNWRKGRLPMTRRAALRLVSRITPTKPSKKLLYLQIGLRFLPGL